MRPYIYLVLAIASEVTGTAALKVSDGFSEVVPTAVVIVAYVGSFYLLSLTLQEFPVGLVYATWSGIGIVAAAVLGVFVFDEHLDAAGVAGMGLIVAGIAVLNLLSDTYTPA